MKIHLFIVAMLLFSVLFIIVPLEKRPVSAGYGSWLYYKKITITNPNDEQQYRINVSKSSGGDVDCEGHCNNNFSDLRLLRTGNATVVPIHYDYVNSGVNAVIWFKNADNDTTLWLYYGNTSAVLIDSPASVWAVWEDWRTTNYLTSYAGFARGATYGYAYYRDISSSFLNGKQIVTNLTYWNEGFKSSVGATQQGLCDSASAWASFYATETLSTYLYNDADDVAGETNADIIHYLYSAHAGAASTASGLVVNRESEYLKNVLTTNTTKAHSELYTKDYVTDTRDLTTTSNLPTDLDYKFFAVTTSTSSGEYGIHYVSNHLMVYEDRDGACNVTVNVSWVGVGNFSDDKTVFSYAVEVSLIIPDPSAPVYFEARTQNSSWIQLNWTKGASGVDKTVILANDTDYPTLADCIIIYNGTGSWYNHTGLINNTHWFYYCYSYNETSKFNTTYLRSHDTTMGIPIAGINLYLHNTSGSYTIWYDNTAINGSYSEDASTNELPADCKDGDWTTFEALADETEYDVVYTKPAGATGAIWHVKDAGAERNFTLTDEMFDHQSSTVVLRIDAAGGTDLVYNCPPDAVYVYFPIVNFNFWEENITWLYEGYVVNFTSESQLLVVNNSAHVYGPLVSFWNGTSFKWVVYVNLTGNQSGLVVAENIVGAVGTHDYQWRPLLGNDGEWWVWANYTGTATGGGTGANLTIINPNPGNGTHSTNYLKRDTTGLTTSVDVTYNNFTTPPATLPGDYNITINSTLFTNTPTTWNTSTVYASVWNNATGGIATSGPLYVGQMNTGGDYTTFRSFLRFNTSILPDEAVITSAYVKLIVWQDFSDTDFNVTLASVKDPKPHNPLIPSDYSRSGIATGGSGHTNTTGYTDDDVFNIVLNAAGIINIDPTFYTNFSVRSHKDINATAPNLNDNEWITFYGNAMPIANYPKLIINYTVPSSAWQHIVNITFYNTSSGIPYGWANAFSNGTVTVPAPMFNGVDVYSWNVTCESNHTNWFNSTVWDFETVVSGGASVIISMTNQANSIVVGGPLLLSGCVVGLIFNRRRRKRNNDGEY